MCVKYMQPLHLINRLLLADARIYLLGGLKKKKGLTGELLRQRLAPNSVPSSTVITSAAKKGTKGDVHKPGRGDEEDGGRSKALQFFHYLLCWDKPAKC